ILFRQDGLQRLRNIERLRRRAVYGDLGRNLDLVARQNVDRLAYLDCPDAFAIGVTRNLELDPLRVGIVVRERGAYCGYLDTCIQARGFLYDPFDRVLQIACDVVELLCGECGSAAGSREAAFAGRVYDVREVAFSVRIPLSILPIERSRSHGIVAQHFAGVSDN